MIFLFLILCRFTIEAAVTIPTCIDDNAPNVPASGTSCPFDYIPAMTFAKTRLVCCHPDDIHIGFFCSEDGALEPNQFLACLEPYILSRDAIGKRVCCDPTMAEPVTASAEVTTPSGVTDPPETLPPVFTTPRRPPSPRPTTPSSSRCLDLVNPITGLSDCPPRAFLCNDPTYYELMTQNCPMTCGRCSVSATTRLPGTGGSGGAPGDRRCEDRVNPRTGLSDCPSLISLCNDATYFQLMTKNCPKSCGRCPSLPSVPSLPNPGRPDPGIPGSGGSSGGVCIDQPNRFTGRSDCAYRRHLCGDYTYSTLMRLQCAATCGFC